MLAIKQLLNSNLLKIFELIDTSVLSQSYPNISYCIESVTENASSLMGMSIIQVQTSNTKFNGGIF